jgi:hypothetical protein
MKPIAVQNFLSNINTRSDSYSEFLNYNLKMNQTYVTMYGTEDPETDPETQ